MTYSYMSITDFSMILTSFMLLPEIQHPQPSVRIRRLLGRYDEQTTPKINIQFEKQCKQTPNAHLKPFRGTIGDTEWLGIDHIQ